jgi:phage virion morphogenesis protein
MFQKLRTASFLKEQSDGNTINAGFTGRIARVHQHGLKDRPKRGSPDVKYWRREMLGFTDADYDIIRDGLVTQLPDKS